MAITFAELLRDYRLKKTLTQEALAERVGLTRGYIASLEQGVRRNPSADTLSKLAEALGLSDAERQELVLSLQGVTLGPMKKRWGSPVLEALAEFLALPPRSPQAPKKLREVYIRLMAILKDRGLPGQQRKEARWLSLLTEGYMYSPSGDRSGKAKKGRSDKRASLPRSVADEYKMANKLQLLLEIFVDGRIHISRRAKLADDLLKFAKWQIQEGSGSAGSARTATGSRRKRSGKAKT